MKTAAIHPVLPEFLKELPDSANIDAKVIAEIFKISVTSITHYVRQGCIPPCFKRFTSGFSHKCSGKTARQFWKLGEIRKFIKEKEVQA